MGYFWIRVTVATGYCTLLFMTNIWNKSSGISPFLESFVEGRLPLNENKTNYITEHGTVNILLIINVS